MDTFAPLGFLDEHFCLLAAMQGASRYTWIPPLPSLTFLMYASIFTSNCCMLALTCWKETPPDSIDKF